MIPTRHSRNRFRTVQGVVDWRLCLGCGACAALCPEQKIRLVDALDEGIRPLVANEQCRDCSLCLDLCPGLESNHEPLLQRPGLLPSLAPAFGPVLEVWEGHAADPEIRRMGSSGGLITALALHSIEKASYQGVIHIAGDPADPIRNRTMCSRSRAELLNATGSRYAPASACDSLRFLDSNPGPFFFVGQPAEIIALRKAQLLRPNLVTSVPLAVSFFCAGSPATAGTLALLAKFGIPPAEVEQLRYRGMGWPGHFAVRQRGQSEWNRLMTYEQSWGFLQRFRPFSVHLHPDASGESADISCGDPWYRPPDGKEIGLSLVLVRTEAGRAALRQAREDGFVSLQPLDPEKAVASQMNLVRKRGAIWGRIATLRALGIPAPKLRGFSLFSHWRKLPLADKLKSSVGTARRALQRRYYRPLVLPKDRLTDRPADSPLFSQPPLPSQSASPAAPAAPATLS